MANGFTHAYFLRPLIDEIVRTKGAALAGTIAPPTAEAIESEFKAAAIASAQAFFGASTPIAVDLVTELGQVRFYQVLRAVKTAVDPKTEIELRALREVSDEFAKVKEGDQVRFPIDHDGHLKQMPIEFRGDVYDVWLRRAMEGKPLPLPMDAADLKEPLTEALNRVACRYFPAPSFAEDTIGGLLTNDGGWTKGVRATVGAREVWVEGATFEFYRTEANRGWVHYGFTFGMRSGGHERRVRFYEECGYGLMEGWLSRPTSADAKSTFVEVLGKELDAMIAALRDREELGAAGSFLKKLLASALRPPIPGGFWDWLKREMPALLCGRVHEVSTEEGAVRFEVAEFLPPRSALEAFGDSALRVETTSTDPTLEPEPSEGLSTGSLNAASLSLRGPADDAERRDLERIVTVFWNWVTWRLDDQLARGSYETNYGGYCSFFGFQSSFPLIALLEQRLRRGPPDEVPVPPFDDAALNRAAEIVKPVLQAKAASKPQAKAGSKGRPKKGLESLKDVAPKKTTNVIATFKVEDWTINLTDDTKDSPWGAYLGISLLAPGEEVPVQVLQVDPWSAPASVVIDGDAFAFGRFITWLREAIVRGGHDATLVYRCEDVEEEDEDEEESPKSRKKEMKLSEWLGFGSPDAGDRFLVDWRAQSNFVPAGLTIEAFRGIFGYSPEVLERFRARDIPLWRRFLREVIDPRFALTTGEALTSRSADSADR